MSCFICSYTAIKTLAAAIATLYNSYAYQCTGISMPKSVRLLIKGNSLTDAHFFADENKIAAALYAENVKAYDGRYKDHPCTVPAPDFAAVEAVSLVRLDNKWKNGRHTISEWYFRLLKLSEMYLYQINEDATADGRIYLAMRDFVIALRTAIAHNDPRYEQNGWGEWY